MKVSQLQALDSDQISVLTDAQLQSLNATQIGSLTTDQLRALLVQQVDALTTIQIQALKGSQVAALTQDQVSGLTTAQAASLTAAELTSLTTTQITALDTADLHAMSTTQIAAFSNAQIAAMSTSQLMALNPASSRYSTPLILDLDGNGVSTLGLGSGVQFDINATGQKISTGWVAPTDGLLALDRNHNGTIDDGSELFGSATILPDGSKAANGYAALAALDTNHDGVIDSRDSAYADLVVWVDSNSDGISESGELHSLASLNIASISVNDQAASSVQNGNIVGLTSTYTSTDGSTHAAADVWFATGAAAQSATPAVAPVALSSSVSSLSQAIGAYSASGLADARFRLDWRAAAAGERDGPGAGPLRCQRPLAGRPHQQRQCGRAAGGGLSQPDRLAGREVAAPSSAGGGGAAG